MKQKTPNDAPADAIRIVLAHIDRGTYPYPYRFDLEAGQEVLCLRTSDVMRHLRSLPTLEARSTVAALRSDRALKKALATAGLLLVEPGTHKAQAIERTVWSRRIGHMVAVLLPGLGHTLPSAIQAPDA